MANKWKIGKFQFIRITTDLMCVLVGCGLFKLGGGEWRAIPTIAGVGTIVTAFFMGPLIEFFNVKFARPFLNAVPVEEPVLTEEKEETTVPSDNE